MRAWAMLGRRTIATLWVGQVLSSIGDYFYNIGIMWTAARLAGTDAGLVAAAQAGSVLVFGMLGGVIADRFDRRRSMIVADVVRAAAVAYLPIAASFGALGIRQLVLVAIVLGALDAVFVPALLASLPAIVDDAEELQATNGLMDSTRRIARAVGPGLAGVVAARVSVPSFFTVDALSFAASAGALLSIAGRHGWAPAPSARAGRPRGLRGVVADMGDALRLVRQNSVVLWAFGALFVVNATWCAGFYVGSVFLASRVLGGGVDAFAFIIGAYGVGNIAGNLVITNVFIRRKVTVIFSAKLVLAAGFVLLALAPSLPVAMLGAAIAAVGGPLGELPLVATLQGEFARHQTGRIFSLRMMVEQAGVALGLLGSTFLFAHVDVRVAIAGCAVAIGLSGVAGLVRFGIRT
jgi:MFS transporter, DHA3 family, macrolide efflux protein